MGKEKLFSEYQLMAALSIGLVLGVVAGMAIYAFAYPIFQSNEWAAWVQAIGSIGAIIGSYFLGERQYKRDRKERIRLNLERQNKALKLVMAATDLSRNRVGLLDLQMRGDPPVIQRDLLSDVQDCVGVMRESLSEIKHLPVTWALGTQASQILRKVYELADAADLATGDSKDAALTLALRQSNNYLCFSIEFDQTLQSQIDAISNQRAT